MNQDGVSNAFDNILQEIEAVENKLTLEGGDAFKNKRYDDATRLSESGKRLQSFREKLELLGEGVRPTHLTKLTFGLIPNTYKARQRQKKLNYYHMNEAMAVLLTKDGHASRFTHPTCFRVMTSPGKSGFTMGALSAT